MLAALYLDRCPAVASNRSGKAVWKKITRWCLSRSVSFDVPIGNSHRCSSLWNSPANACLNEEIMKKIPTVCVLVALAAIQSAGAADVPAGAYTLDKPHASLLFRVNHLGFSNFTGRFSSFDAQLQFDPQHLNASQVDVTIDPRSLETDNPPAGFLDSLRGAQWLDATQFPQLKFHSTRVETTGEHTFRIHGDLSLHGVTRPVTLEATYNAEHF